MAERWRALRAHAAFTAALTFVTKVFFFAAFFLLFIDFFIVLVAIVIVYLFLRSWS
jgi:hypothetical protein